MYGKKYVLLILAFAFTGAIYAFIYGQIERNKLATLPKKYVYNSNRPLDKSVLFIRKLKYKTAYLEYINSINQESIKKVAIKFPIDNFLPKSEEIYFRAYSSDSSLIKFYSPNYHHKFWGFSTGYIHRYFVHDTLPKD